MFVASFYCYLTYSKNNFVIDLDNIWKWIGFSRKDHAKRLLKKFFIENLDYQTLLPRTGEQLIDDTILECNEKSDDENIKGGHNKEQILLTVNTFTPLEIWIC